MTSNINVNNIITTFPIPGQDNDSQGFRDNFTNIKNSFNAAKAEIEDLQNKAVLKDALISTALNNNMAGVKLRSAEIFDFRETQIDYGTQAGTIILDHARAHYHSVNTNGSITLGFVNMPPNGTVGRIRLKMHINSITHELILPAEVTSGLANLIGWNPSDRTVSFTNTGVCLFEFLSDDHGNTFNISDMTRGNLPVLSPATRSMLGFIKVGDGLDITTDGILTPNAIPTATDTTPGLMKVGDKLSISDGVLSVKQDIGLITSGELNGRLGYVTPNSGTFTDITVGSDDTTVVLNSSLVRINGYGAKSPVIQLGNVNGYGISHELTSDNFVINRDEPVGTGILTALAITPTGNIGIGNTSPQSRLVISGGQGTVVDIRDGGDLRLRNANNTGSTILYCDVDGQLNLSQDLQINRNLYAMGNVGIGTSTANNRLVVVRDGGAGSDAEVVITDGTQWFNFNSNISVGSWSPMHNNSDHAIIYSNGSINTGTLFIGQWSDNPKGLRIDENGNIGIGTTSPVSTLHIANGDINLTNTVSTNFYINETSVGPQLRMKADTTNVGIGATNSYPLLFLTNNAENMRIAPGGNVEVGSANSVAGYYRYFDVYNTSSTTGSGAVIRLVTSNAAATGNTTFDIAKTAAGVVGLYNYETDAAACIAFGVGGYERARVTSTGNVNVQNNLIAGGGVFDSTGNVREIPVKSSSTAYTLQASDDGQLVSTTTGGITVPAGIFKVGQTINIYNNSASSQTITQGSGVTMFQVGTAVTGDRALAQRGLITIVCVDTNTFVVTGGGLS